MRRNSKRTKKQARRMKHGKGFVVKIGYRVCFKYDKLWISQTIMNGDKYVELKPANFNEEKKEYVFNNDSSIHINPKTDCLRFQETLPYKASKVIKGTDFEGTIINMQIYNKGLTKEGDVRETFNSIHTFYQEQLWIEKCRIVVIIEDDNGVINIIHSHHLKVII